MSAIVSKLYAIKNLLDGKIDGAPAFIVNGRFHAYEVLKNRPGTAKIAIGFSKGNARVNFAGGDRTGRENQFYYAIISRGAGLNQVRSDNLTVGSGGGKPLLELAEIMRDGLRAIRFDSTEAGGGSDERPDYVGMNEWGLDQGFNLDAFEVTIWVGTQLPLMAPITTTTTNPV